MKILGLIKCAAVCLIVASCSTTKKVTTQDNQTDRIPLEERRRFDYFFLEGNRQKHLGNLDVAFDLYKKAMEIDTANAPVRFELANFYLNLRRPFVALEYFQKAAETDPENYYYGNSLARMYMSMEKLEEAIATYKDLSEKFPGRPEINYAMADIYKNMGETQEAIAALNRLEDFVGVHETITLEKHGLYMAENQVDSAFLEIDKLIRANPQNVEYQILLGDLYLDLGMIPEADSAYAIAEQTEPENGYLFVSRSDYFNRIGDIQASNQLLRQALINDNLDVATKEKLLTNYLQTLIQKKETLESADSLFTIILDQHPQVSALHELYAELFLYQQKYPEAREQMEFASALNPNNRKTWLGLIGVDMKMENWNGVVETANKGLVYLPQMPELYLYKGVAYSLLNKPKKALDVYQEGLRNMEPSNVSMISNIWGQIGDTYYKLDDLNSAFEAYDEALKYDDKNISVLNNYSYFLSLGNQDLSKAERMAAQAIKLEPNNMTFLDTYAWIFFKQGNYTLAKFYIESALNKNEEVNAEILEHYGDILFKLNETDKAVEQWEKALEVLTDEDTNINVPVLKKKVETRSYIE